MKLSASFVLAFAMICGTAFAQEEKNQPAEKPEMKKKKNKEEQPVSFGFQFPDSLTLDVRQRLPLSVLEKLLEKRGLEKALQLLEKTESIPKGLYDYQHLADKDGKENKIVVGFKIPEKELDLKNLGKFADEAPEALKDALPEEYKAYAEAAFQVLKVLSEQSNFVRVSARLTLQPMEPQDPANPQARLWLNITVRYVFEPKK